MPTSSKSTSRANAPDCTGCVLHDRRSFLRDAVVAVSALVGLSAISAVPAFAQIRAIEPVAGAGKNEMHYPIPAADGVAIDEKNEVIIARSAGTAYAFALSCPHQNTALRWLDKDHRFQCPKHKSKYKPDGEFISGRATRNMDRLPIKKEGNMLVVDIATEIRSDEEAAKWAAAMVSV